MKNRYRELNKMCDRITRVSKKFNRMDYLEYEKFLGDKCIAVNRDDNRDKFLILTESNAKFRLRCSTVNILRQINYHRNADKWTEPVAIAFMHEVMLYYGTTCIKSTGGSTLEDISERYNVKQNRIKTQMALFLLNYKKGTDKFNIDNHFTQLELLLWEYRDCDKEDLQKIIEKQILTEDTLTLVRKIFNLEG